MTGTTRRSGLVVGLLATAWLAGCDKATSGPVTTAGVRDLRYQAQPALAALARPHVWVEPGGDAAGEAMATADGDVRAMAGNVVRNGEFEAGFAGWTVVDQAGGSGSWFLHSGPTSPLSGLTVPAPPLPPQVMSDQTGPGSHILYQDVTIPSHGGYLSFTLSIDNWAGAYHNPPSLDFSVNPNQQFRVDIVSPSDPVETARSLKRVYGTERGMPFSFSTRVSSDMKAFAGQTVRLRFAEVDNQLFFNVGLDNVRIR